MPYQLTTFYASAYDIGDYYGYIETPDESERQKWIKQVLKSHGKDTSISELEFSRLVYSPPPKEVKAKREDTA